ncbi:UNVERIFIED_CONTAM: hypothetical protein K2H54_077627 [Gekko kuhli]
MQADLSNCCTVAGRSRPLTEGRVSHSRPTSRDCCALCEPGGASRSQLRLPMEAPLRSPKRGTCTSLLEATKRVVKLYLLGLLLSSPPSLACWASLGTGQTSAWEDGQLRQLLHSPDYNLFPNSAVFESDFVQVTKKGKCVDFTNMPTIVSVGVTSSDPCLPLPNVLLMARRKVLDKGFAAGGSKTPEPPVPELSRLLPLRHVRLSVHLPAQRILRLQTVTRKVYYLQLHRDYPKVVFGLWSRLADILKRGLSTTPKDPAIRVRHSLVPSGSSPSGSSSGEPFSDAASPSWRATNKQGWPAAAGDSSQRNPSGRTAGSRTRQSQPSPKRVSFQQLPAKHQADVRGDLSAAPGRVEGLLHDPSPFPVCKWCKGRLSRHSGKPQSTGRHAGVQQLQQEEPTTSWRLPLSRLWRGTQDPAGRK